MPKAPDRSIVEAYEIKTRPMSMRRGTKAEIRTTDMGWPAEILHLLFEGRRLYWSKIFHPAHMITSDTKCHRHRLGQLNEFKWKMGWGTTASAGFWWVWLPSCRLGSGDCLYAKPIHRQGIGLKLDSDLKASFRCAGYLDDARYAWCFEVWG